MELKKIIYEDLDFLKIRDLVKKKLCKLLKKNPSREKARLQCGSLLLNNNKLKIQRKIPYLMEIMVWNILNFCQKNCFIPLELLLKKS